MVRYKDANHAQNDVIDEDDVKPQQVEDLNLDDIDDALTKWLQTQVCVCVGGGGVVLYDF